MREWLSLGACLLLLAACQAPGAAEPPGSAQATGTSATTPVATVSGPSATTGEAEEVAPSDEAAEVAQAPTAHPLAGKRCAGMLTSQVNAWQGAAAFVFEGARSIDAVRLVDSRGSELIGPKAGEAAILSQGGDEIAFQARSGVRYALSFDPGGERLSGTYRYGPRDRGTAAFTCGALAE